MNRRLVSVILGIALCTPLAAMSEDAPAPPGMAAAGTGTIVFFRDKKFVGGGMNYKVREGDVEIGKLSNGSYFIVQAPVGKHEYTVHSEAKDVLTLEVESGETYYVIGGLSMGVLAGRPNLSPAKKEDFEALKPKLKDVTGVGIGPKKNSKKK